MNELIQSVESVFSKKENNALNSTFQYYYVPLYQRGYKWTKSQIEKLLIDINNFEYKSGKFYCVQNITLVPNPKGNCYNVVDGQQRLTTMTLILSILGENELVNGKLKFPSNSIRQYTNTFIQDWVIAGKKIPSDWEAFISSDANYDHQDIFHLFNGIHIINNWFDNNEIDKDAYKKKLLNHVKFICNKIEGEKEEKIFGNLNSKRVYLDGADLIRAILITRVTKENAEDESIKNVVRINERRVRIGWELDTVNQWWNQKEVQEYFSPFIQIAVSGEINFDFKKYPINQLFALYASFKNWESLSLERIEQVENTVQLYNELQKLHLELMDWYAHKEIYHYLGFLFHQSSSPKFGEVLNYYRHCKTKEEFTQYLLLTVKDVLFGEDNIEDIFNDNKDWYSEDSLTPTLLFLDIIEAIKDNRNRLHVSAFLKRENDIEHIHPQTPQNEKDKKGYLKFLIEKKEEILKDERVVNQKIESLDSEVLDAIIEDYKDKISTNSIGNLVLLYYSLNRSIQNNSYAYKRKRVLDYYNQGNYIQPHTLKVFSRYFQGEDSANTDGKFWTQDDIEENAKNIKSTLKNFFTKHINNEC